MKHYFVIVFLVVCFHSSAQLVNSKVWVADAGNGTYKNPVINADYSDPDVVRVGNDYYLISSSFNHAPGLPILHSNDLVNWSIIGHALKNLTPDSHFLKVQHGGGVWAPSIRFHAGEFFIYYPDPDFGIYMTKSKSIMGPWSQPVMVEAGKGLIDPCPLWDDNGKVYLVHAFAGSRAGIKSVIVIKMMNAEGTRTIDDGVLVYDGHEKDPTIEGPKLYKRNGFYYIFAPAGGVSTGWQVVLRSKNIYGPYERKVVMDQGNSSVNGPHQGAWVNTVTGEDWFLHFQDKEAYGRVVHLQPMQWINDWPVIGIDKDNDGRGEPVSNFRKPEVAKKYPVKTVQDSDEFNSPKIGLQWQWQANHHANNSFTTNAGVFRMYSVFQADSVFNLWNYPGILAQKLPAEEFTARLKLTFNPLHKGERFGLIMLGTDYAYLAIEKKADGMYVTFNENIKADQDNSEQRTEYFPVKGNVFYLEIKVKKAGVCSFSFAESDEQYRTFSKLFTMKPGKWVGAKLGMFCLRNNKTNDAGFADIDWFRIEQNKK